MPIQFREQNLVVTTSYHIGGNEKVENEEKVDKMAFEVGHSCAKKIDFSYEDLLWGMLVNKRLIEFLLMMDLPSAYYH